MDGKDKFSLLCESSFPLQYRSLEALGARDKVSEFSQGY